MFCRALLEGLWLHSSRDDPRCGRFAGLAKGEGEGLGLQAFLTAINFEGLGFRV